MMQSLKKLEWLIRTETSRRKKLMDKMRMESVDMTEKNIDRIAALFPNCITEALDEERSTPDHKVYKKVVNFELLRQMLSGEVLEGDEAYEFTWVGKKAAIVEANKPIRKTLRPYPEESVNWDATENLYIEGDNLEVLKLLQESYMGKVKLIFIDPPYNTGSDFIYADDFAVGTAEYSDEIGEMDADGNRLFKNTDSNGRFHSDWCSMMYSRLMLARNLLTDDGSIFISIDFNEVENLKKIMDEVFGAENFQREIVWRIGWLSGYKTMAPNFIRNHDTILFYSKNSSKIEFIKKYIENKDFKPLLKKDAKVTAKLKSLGLDDEQQKELLEFINHGNRPDRYPIEDTWNSNEYDDLNSIAIVSFSGEKISKILEVDQDFKGQKSVKMLMRIIEATTKEDDIVMDFFSGTGSTAHAVMQMNAEDGCHRKYIMVQLPEPCEDGGAAKEAGYDNICEIGKERIRRIGQRINDAAPLVGLDTGFRVFKVAESNMNDVYYSAGEYNQGMLSLLESNVKPDRSDIDLLFGCLLEWGLPLSMPYTSEQIEGCTVHTYNEGDLIACFDENIPDSVIKAIAKRQPLRAVFRDSSFNGSPAKINVGEIFKMLAPDTRIKVI
jgi:adenine-specific DNA-methyltransferase